MNEIKMPRVMWLLNHTAARSFEVPMLKSIGVREIFLPKIIPNDLSVRSASIDWSEDQGLTIPADDLEILNSADWYNGASKSAWEVANKHFGIAFIVMLQNPRVLENASKFFHGVVSWRVYGQHGSLGYAKMLAASSSGQGAGWLRHLGSSFVFCEAYPHLAEIEPSFVRRNRVFLPLGLGKTEIKNNWSGINKAIYFVCPDIGFDPYYASTHRKFIADFGDLPYVIGGAQRITVDDSRVLGFLPQDIHEKNMREFRVMFYHSSEKHHIHYHPFEAVRSGMPLVFMAGGILDRLGGINLPGRCETLKEARKKVERILNDDWGLIEAIRKSQVCLLEPMKPENCEPIWRAGFQRILERLDKANARSKNLIRRKPRIAVILPATYQGEKLQIAKLIAQAIEVGSRQADQAVEVILAHPEAPTIYPEKEFVDLPSSIKRRSFNWRTLEREEAYRAMAYAGLEREMALDCYQVPDDGMQQFMDCDLWVVISDRLALPLLPVRPYICVVLDYSHRYELVLPPGAGQGFIYIARWAERVLVTTKFTEQDALQYAGISHERLCRVPLLMPTFDSAPALSAREVASSYFFWITVNESNSNLANALLALKEYYEELGGELECRLVGIDTSSLLKSELGVLGSFVEVLESSGSLRTHLIPLGKLSKARIQQQLAGAAFLWQPSRIDNGTFDMVEAAGLGVPTLSSDYPVIHEINERFTLNLAWMDQGDSHAMATQLKLMEMTYQERKNYLPTRAQLAAHHVERLAGEYWRAIRECL